MATHSSILALAIKKEWNRGICGNTKANQQEKISFKVAELRDYFPRHYTAAQMMQEIKVALKERQQRLARQRDHSR